MTSKELAKIAVNALDDKKGEDIRIIEISEISTIADYFIIASGNNTNVQYVSTSSEFRVIFNVF